jgi:cell division protein YceG involved in septum cleavage
MKFSASLIICITLLMLPFSSVSAQVERVLYQTFYLQDSTDNITINMKDNYEIIVWNHEKDVMVESTVDIRGGSMDLLKNFINEGRYLVKPKLDSSTTIVELAFGKEKREALTLKGRVCEETVFHRIYIPSEYTKVSDTLYSRKPEPILVTKN